jgi:hypothetical protein
MSGFSFMRNNSGFDDDELRPRLKKSNNGWEVPLPDLERAAFVRRAASLLGEHSVQPLFEVGGVSIWQAVNQLLEQAQVPHRVDSKKGLQHEAFRLARLADRLERVVL